MPWLGLAVLAAAGIAAAGTGVRLHGPERWARLGGVLSWGGLLLMLSTASGLPLDLLRAASLVVLGIMPAGIDWPGLATRALALAAVVVLGRRFLSCPASPTRARAASWYAIAAVALALPYPSSRPGGPGREPRAQVAGSVRPCRLVHPLAAGRSVASAAALSLCLALAPRWLPRRLLLVAGWSATVVVAAIGPLPAGRSSAG